MMELLGFPESYFFGKEPWQLGVVAHRRTSQDTLEELRTHGYVRYEHLPLQTRDGEQVQVEAVCNTYHVQGVMSRSATYAISPNAAAWKS